MSEVAVFYAIDARVLMACAPSDVERVQLWVDQHLDWRLYRVHPSSVVPPGSSFATLPWLN